MGHDDSRPVSAWDVLDDPMIALRSDYAGLFRRPEIDPSLFRPPPRSPDLLADLGLRDISGTGGAMLDAMGAASDWARGAEERSRTDALLRGAMGLPAPQELRSHTATWPTQAGAAEEPEEEEAPWPQLSPRPASAATRELQPVSIRLLIDHPTLGLLVLGQTEPAVFDGTRSLRLVIDDPHLGLVVLGSCEAPILDGTTAIELVIDDPTLGPMVIGWSTNHPEYIARQALAGPPVTLIPLEQSTAPAAASHASSQALIELASGDGADGDEGSLGSGDDLGGLPDTVGTNAYNQALSRRSADMMAAVRSGRAVPAHPQETAPPPIDPASLPPGRLSRADYERVAARNVYLASLYDPGRFIDRALNLVTRSMDDPANVLTPAERAEHEGLTAKLYETILPPPTPAEARIDAMEASPIGTAASVAVGAAGGSQQAQVAALSAVGTVDQVAMAIEGTRSSAGARIAQPVARAPNVEATPPRPARVQASSAAQPTPGERTPVPPSRQTPTPAEQSPTEDSRITSPTGQAAAPVLPTPRTGVIGGKPTGIPEAAPRAKAKMQESLAIQQSTLEAMAAAGYIVELQPEIRPSDGTDPEKEPDGRLGGNIADVYVARTRKLEEIRNALSDKVKKRQAFHLILNLSLVPEVNRADVEYLLQRKPIGGLREFFIVEKNGAINRIFPNPEQIVAPKFD